MRSCDPGVDVRRLKEVGDEAVDREVAVERHSEKREVVELRPRRAQKGKSMASVEQKADQRRERVRRTIFGNERNLQSKRGSACRPTCGAEKETRNAPAARAQVDLLGAGLDALVREVHARLARAADHDLLAGQLGAALVLGRVHDLLCRRRADVLRQSGHKSEGCQGAIGRWGRGASVRTWMPGRTGVCGMT